MHPEIDKLSSKDLIAILKTSLTVFLDTYGEDISAIRIQTLMTVCLEPGILQSDMMRALDKVAQGTVVRNVKAWTKRKQDGTPGAGFILQRPDHEDPRKFALDPTPQAAQWLGRLAVKIKENTGIALNVEQLAVLLRMSMSRIRAATDTDIAVYRMLALLTVMEHPGIEQSEMEQQAELGSEAAVSRNVINLGLFKYNKEPGPDFVKQENDPIQRKHKRLYPTIKAQHWLETVADQVSAKLLKMKDK